MNSIERESLITWEVEKSKFLGYTRRVSSTDELKEAIQSIREEHPTATHVVHAAVIGNTGELFSCSDDGEPSGSSGPPILEILKGQNLSFTAVIVVRYFGGKKLGVGGLVRAYGDSARQVLAKSGSTPLLWKAPYTITLPYDLHPKVVRALEKLDIPMEEQFAEMVTISGMIEKNRVTEASEEVTSITRGSYSLTIGEFSLL